MSLIQIKAKAAARVVGYHMRNFIYRCPVTKFNVQGSVDDKEAEGKEYVPQTCLACRLIHMVSPVNGDLMPEKLQSRDKS